MPTYEEIFGPTYDSIENYPEEYLEKKIRYPLKRGKDPRFGEMPKNRIDSIIDEPERIGKSNPAQSDFMPTDEPVIGQLKKGNYISSTQLKGKADNPVESAVEATAKTQRQIGKSEQTDKTKIRTPIASTKTGKSGDNVI